MESTKKVQNRKDQSTNELLNLKFRKINLNKKKSEYDYDEIVAASEIEVDEIIDGDSRNSAEHDEL
jgi:hypothetical protein